MDLVTEWKGLKNVATGRKFKIYVDTPDGPFLLGAITEWTRPENPVCNRGVEIIGYSGNLTNWRMGPYYFQNIAAKAARTKEMIFR